MERNRKRPAYDPDRIRRTPGNRVHKVFKEAGTERLKHMGTVPFPTPTLEKILASDLFIDTAYERPLSPEWARSIATEFDPDKFHPLTVSARDNGYAVIDGQHRLAAVTLLGWSNQLMPCLVYRGMTIESEAELFATQSDRRRLSRHDLHRAAVTAQRPEAVAVENAIVSAGYRTAPVRSKNPDAIDAISAAYTCCERGSPELFAQILMTLRQTWRPRDWQPTPAAMLGLRAFLVRYGAEVDGTVLMSVLSELPPGDLSRLERGQREIMGGSVDTNAARVITQRYNQKRRSKKLPDWDRSIEG